MLSFYIKGFYVIGKALSGELSCPCNRSCWGFFSQQNVRSSAKILPNFTAECISAIGFVNTVKILKIGTPEIITIIVPQLEQMDFTVQYGVEKMQTE